MTTTQTQADLNLRQRAEEIAKYNLVSPQEALSHGEMQRLLHELQVHQIELQMQNDELHRAMAFESEHKAHLENIIKMTPAGYFRIDREGRFLEVNTAWLRMHGYDSPDEVIGKHFSIMQVDSDSNSALLHLAELQRGVSIPFGEFSSNRKDGSVGHHIFSAHPVVHVGAVVGFEWFIIDISERYQAEEALRRTKNMLARTEQITHIGSWEWEIATDTVIWSEELFRIHQLNPADGTPSLAEQSKLYHPEDMAELKRVVDRASDEGIPYELELRALRRDGETRYCLARGFAEKDTGGRIARLFGSLQDITESKLAEKALKESEYFFKESQRAASIGSYRNDFVSGMWESSEVLDTIFGIDKEYNRNVQGWLDIIHTDDRQMMDQYLREEVTSKRNPFSKEYRVVRKNDGEIRWVFGLGEVTYDSNGTIQLLIGTIQDITERKKAEEALRERIKELNCLYAIASLIEKEDSLDKICQGAVELMPGSWSHDEIACARIIMDNQEFKTANFQETGLRQTADITPFGEPSGIVELCYLEERPLMDEGPFLREERSLINAIALQLRRIVERKMIEEEKKVLERQMQQAQKLESLGVLAGGIAHDFNNILAIIMGYCGLTKLDYDTAEKNMPHIEMAVERAAALCRQMLSYAGKAPIILSPVNMRMLVDEMVTMLKASLPQNSEIDPDLATEIPFIKGDASQIKQIIMNLIINASEAIGTEHGKIRVSLATTSVIAGQSDRDYNGKSIPPGEYVCLEVTDNGCGMDEEIKWRIFEPFYTTKFTGRGLGMSAVLGIINSHGGALQLHSQLGQGTTFKVYLPVQKNDSAINKNMSGAVPSPPWRGSGTILLVEDEDQVRLVAKALLKNIGFTVLEAMNGKEALELYQRNATDISVVLTDMGMPVMDGYELFYELKKLNPGLPIIVSSGYGDDEVGSRIGTDNIAGLISKPYGLDQLRDVLKRALEGA